MSPGDIFVHFFHENWKYPPKPLGGFLGPIETMHEHGYPWELSQNIFGCNQEVLQVAPGGPIGSDLRLPLSADFEIWGQGFRNGAPASIEVQLYFISCKVYFSTNIHGHHQMLPTKAYAEINRLYLVCHKMLREKRKKNIFWLLLLGVRTDDNLMQVSQRLPRRSWFSFCPPPDPADYRSSRYTHAHTEQEITSLRNTAYSQQQPTHTDSSFPRLAFTTSRITITTIGYLGWMPALAASLLAARLWYRPMPGARTRPGSWAATAAVIPFCLETTNSLFLVRCKTYQS